MATWNLVSEKQTNDVCTTNTQLRIAELSWAGVTWTCKCFGQSSKWAALGNFSHRISLSVHFRSTAPISSEPLSTLQTPCYSNMSTNFIYTCTVHQHHHKSIRIPPLMIHLDLMEWVGLHVGPAEHASRTVSTSPLLNFSFHQYQNLIIPYIERMEFWLKKDKG